MTDIQIVILDTIKELAIENNVNEDEIKYFQIAYSLASKLCKAKNNEVLDLVSECCGNPDIIQTTVTYQAPYETLDEMELTICRKCKKSISAKFSNFR